LDKDPLRAGMGQAKRELEGLPPVAQREMVKVSRIMQSEGQKSGGVLAQGIRGGLVRASPLIVAGVSGALAAGAPAVLAASSLLFGGIGAAAAAQDDQVRQAWVGLGNFIKDEARDIAAPVVDTYERMAGQVGASFSRLEAPITRAVAAAAPQLERLLGSSLQMAENALPGMARAAENAGPAMEGLGSFLESVGTGAGEFFDTVSQHSPAAGAAMVGLGQTIGSLLPVLGELLGSGAELAAVVLPPVADAMEDVADVAAALGPLLPAIGAGFAAMKVAGLVTGGMKGLSGVLATVAQNAALATYQVDGFGGRAAGRASEGASRMSRATASASESLGKMGAVLPGIGVLMALHASKMSDAESQEQRWSDALLEGGAAADQAAAQAEAASGKYADSWVGNLSRTLDEWAGIQPSMEDAQAATDEYVASLSPLEAAQLRVQQAQAKVNEEAAKGAENSPALVSAQGELSRATADVEREQGRLELALSGVTQAMIDQANQALAAIDSGFAYQHALNGLEDAQLALTEAQNTHGASSEEARRAQLDLTESAYQAAMAFGQQQADMSGAGQDTAEYARIIQEEALGELYRLRDAAGPELAAALSEQIRFLEASGIKLGSTGVQAQATRDRMRELGITVSQEVPGYKGVIIHAPTEDQRRRLSDLGMQVVTLPNGQVYVTADTADAEAALRRLTVPRYTTVRVDEVLGVQVRRQPGGRVVERASGAFVEYYADGGLRPMRADVADVVPANSWRVIGDRPTGDEAFIPINNSARSQSILELTAERMGYELRKMAGGGLLTSRGPTSHKWDPARENDRAYTAWWDSLIRAGWKGRPGDREERIYAPANTAPRPVVVAPRTAPAPTTRQATTTAGGRDACSHPLFNVESVNLVQGTPQEVARILALEARTRG
jgi:hypothetical protein